MDVLLLGTDCKRVYCPNRYPDCIHVNRQELVGEEKAPFIREPPEAQFIIGSV